MAHSPDTRPPLPALVHRRVFPTASLQPAAVRAPPARATWDDRPALNPPVSGVVGPTPPSPRRPIPSLESAPVCSFACLTPLQPVLPLPALSPPLRVPTFPSQPRGLTRLLPAMATATAAAPAVAAMAAAGEDALASLRAAAAAILARGGAPTAAAKEEYAGLMARWAAAGGPADDAVVAVGSAVYGVEAAAAAKPAAEAKAAAPAVAYARVDFDFLEGFMKDVFVQYGVPDEEAVTAAKVRRRRSALRRRPSGWGKGGGGDGREGDGGLYCSCQPAGKLSVFGLARRWIDPRAYVLHGSPLHGSGFSIRASSG